MDGTQPVKSTREAKDQMQEQKQIADFGLLPFLAIQKIYEYLDYNDIKVASQICNSWRVAKYHNSFYISNTVVQLLSSNVMEFLRYQSSLPPFKNFHLTNIDIKILDAFSDPERSDAVHELTLACTEIDSNIILLMKQMQNLKKLTFIKCSFSTLNLEDTSNITHLTLDNYEELGLLTFYDLLVFFPNLEYLNISYYSYRMSNSNFFISHSRSITELLNYLPSTLKEFHFFAHKFKLPHEFQQPIVFLKKKDLKKITIQSNLLHMNVIKILLESQKNLIHLNLSNYNILDSNTIDILTDNLQLLEELIMKNSNLKDPDVEKLVKLKKLRLLNISYDNKLMIGQLTSKCISYGVALNKNETLRELYLGNIRLFYEDVIRIIENLPNLIAINFDCYALELSKCIIDDHIINHISKNLINLKYLNLRGSYCITNKSLIPQLDQIGKNNYKMNNVIGNLKNLHTLILSDISNINDNTLIYGIKYLNLKTLKLDNCRNITVKGIQILSKNCPSIEILSLRNCINIRDYAINEILENFHRLKKLDIRGCNIKERMSTFINAKANKLDILV